MSRYFETDMSRLSGASYPPAHAHYPHIPGWKGLVSTMGVLQDKHTHLYKSGPSKQSLFGLALLR